MRIVELTAHNADRERDERELIGASFTIQATNRASLHVFGAIQLPALSIVAFQDMMTEQFGAIRRADNDEIVATDMPNKVFHVAVVVYHLLTNLCNKQNHRVAGQKAVDIIEGFEVIEVQVEDAPGINAVDFVVHRSLQL